MAKYLVGISDNTWDFSDAYSHAKAGDTIEFEPNFKLIFSDEKPFVFDKNLKFLGHIEEKDGQNYFQNTIKGAFVLKLGCELTFSNIWFELTNNICNIQTNEICGLTFERCYFEHTEKTSSVEFLSTKFNTELTFDKCGSNMEGNADQWINIKDAIVVIKNSHLMFRIAGSRFEMTVDQSTLENYVGNVLNLKESSLEVNDSVIRGGNAANEFPVIWAEGSKFTFKGTHIDGNHDMYICKNSRGKIQDSKVSQVHLSESVLDMKNTNIEKYIILIESSYLYNEGQLLVKGLEVDKIPLYLQGHSTLTAESIVVENEISPIIRLKEGAVLTAKDFIYSKGDAALLDYEVEAGSQLNINQNYMGNSSSTGEREVAETSIDSPEERTSQDNYTALQSLVGLDSVKQKVDEMISLVEYNKKRVADGKAPLKQVLHSVFMGNPGTGKTTVARLVGKILFEKGALTGKQFKFVEVGETELLSGYVNQTAEQTKAKIEEARGGVLFIDEAYTLNKKGTNETGSEAITTLLKYMEEYRNEIMIIFAGYTKEMEQFLQTNPGLKSRVPNTFDFEDYTSEQIVDMGLKNLAADECQLEDVDYYTRKVSQEYQRTLDKSNGRWIRNFNEKLLKALAFRVMKEQDDDISIVKNVDIDTVLAMGAYQDNGTKKDAMQELQSLIGLAKVKEQVEEFIAQAALNRKREEEGHSTATATLHSLFLGNPGTGKTTVARIIGELLYQKGLIANNKLIEVSRGDLVGAYQGQTAEKTREQLHAALGGVLFIDEAYALKQSPNDSFGQEAIDEILKFMEDHRQDMVVIFAGYSKEMQEFMQTNSGLTSRVPNVFDFEDYTPEEIVQIGLFGLHSQGYQFDESSYSEAVKQSYQRTNDFSNGRWVRNFNQKLLGNMSKRIAREESTDYNTITQQDLDKMQEF